jgi:hypothetical protein
VALGARGVGTGVGVRVTAGVGLTGGGVARGVTVSEMADGAVTSAAMPRQ